MKRSFIRQVVAPPSPCLRTAFWGMILTSGIYWILALLLGGLFLSSCSGSIFKGSEKKDDSTPPVAPVPATPSPAPADRDLAPPPQNQATRDGAPRDVSVVPLPDQRERSTTIVANLGAIEFLFPRAYQHLIGQIETTNESARKRQENDILARLKIRITISSIKPEFAPYKVREVTLTLKDGSKTLSTLRIGTLKVITDVIDTNKRSMLIDGNLQFLDQREGEPRRQRQSNTFISFSMKFQNESLVGLNIARETVIRGKQEMQNFLEVDSSAGGTVTVEIAD